MRRRPYVTLQAHPVADLFPLLGDDELAELAADVRANGLHEPITLDVEQRILDGRNRYRACLTAGVEPRTTVYRGDDPIGFAVSMNLRRRHLTVGQKALVGQAVEKLLAAEARQQVTPKRAAAANQRWARQRLGEETVEALRKPATEYPMADLEAAEPEAIAASRDLQQLQQRVYFARSADRVKIGVAEFPDQRLEALRRGDPGIFLWGTVLGSYQVEHAIHRRLADYRLGHEWFRWCEEVEQVCTDIMHLSGSGQMHPDEIDTLGTAARLVGVSRSALSAAKRLPDDLAEKVRSGDLALDRAERIIRDREAEDRRVKKAREDAANLPERPRVDIRHGDFREVLADLTGVDAVITDPPYPREYLPLLADLAAWADKVLSTDGVLAVLFGQTYLPEVYRLLDGHRPYRWTMAYLTPGNGYASHPARVQSNWKPVLVYGGGPRFSDVLRSEGTDAGAKDLHRWGQDYGAFHTLIERLTRTGQTVADPFAGSGTTLLAAHALGRHVIGADVDEVHVATARERLA